MAHMRSSCPRANHTANRRRPAGTAPPPSAADMVPRCPLAAAPPGGVWSSRCARSPAEARRVRHRTGTNEQRIVTNASEKSVFAVTSAPETFWCLRSTQEFDSLLVTQKYIGQEGHMFSASPSDTLTILTTRKRRTGRGRTRDTPAGWASGVQRHTPAMTPPAAAPSLSASCTCGMGGELVSGAGKHHFKEDDGVSCAQLGL